MQSIGTASSRSWNTPVRVPALVSARAKVISNCHWSPKQLRAISLSLDLCFFIQSTCVCVCVESSPIFQIVRPSINGKCCAYQAGDL